MKTMEKYLISNSYNEMLREIVAEVKTARVVIANRLCASVTQLYWNIEKRLSSEKLDKGYGGKVVEQLSVDLKSEFPNTEGVSHRSLWDMKRFYEFYTGNDQKLHDQKLPQPAAVLPPEKALQNELLTFEREYGERQERRNRTSK